MYRQNFMMFGSKSIGAISGASYNLQKLHKFSTTTTSGAFDAKICVIGAGPAGFYASQHILKTLPNARIDIIEKMPVPFGLVRQVIEREKKLIAIRQTICYRVGVEHLAQGTFVYVCF